MSETEQRPSLVKRFAALVVLAIVAILLVKAVVGFLAGIFTVLLVVAVVIAGIWAYTTLRT